MCVGLLVGSMVGRWVGLLVGVRVGLADVGAGLGDGFSGMNTLSSSFRSISRSGIRIILFCEFIPLQMSHQLLVAGGWG